MHKAFIDTSVILRILVKDDVTKQKAAKRLLLKAGKKGTNLHIPPVTVLEIVWILEKVYKLRRTAIRDMTEAILNTPGLKCELDAVFRNALKIYTEKNIKFADAVMGCWGLDRGIYTVYTYDEKDFGKIIGLKVKKP